MSQSSAATSLGASRSASAGSTQHEHMRITDGRRVDGSWTGGLWRGSDGLYDDPTILQVSCTCGWRSPRTYEIGTPPSLDAVDQRGAWNSRREQAEDECRYEWLTDHRASAAVRPVPS